ncbi:MAG: ABC transporter permease subunit [Candidatus Dormibacteraceae bacterium]
MIIAAIHAELFKVVRRPATWVTVGLMLAIAVGLEYVLVYLVASHPPPGAQRVGVTLATARSGLYPDVVIRKSLANVAGLDGIFALILGVLVQGSEFAWGTVKTSLVQFPGRLSIVFGQLVTIAVLALLMAVGIFALDAIAAYGVAILDSHAVVWPSAGDLLKGVGAAWLILYVLAVLGFALATLARQSAMAIGLGLAYVLVIENLVFGLLDNLGDTFKQLHEWFPIANAGYLEGSFGRVNETISAPPVDATHAVAILALWLAVFIAVAGALMRARDVT